MKKKKVDCALHVFWEIAPHLSIQMMEDLKNMFPTHQFSLYMARERREEFKEKNNTFIRIAKEAFYGKIHQTWFRKLFSKIPIFNVVFQKIGIEITFLSLFKLLFGPRHIILHGRLGEEFNLFTLFWLKLFRKRIYLIHWGGKTHIGRFLGVIDRCIYRSFSHIFVLMSPELEYFKNFIDGSRVSCLPYRLKDVAKPIFNVSPTQDVYRLLLGNSAHQRSNYCEILNKLYPLEWKKITCMLNYGDEGSVKKTDDFVQTYKKKFGDVFFAWRTVLPWNEYVKVLEESALYICIEKTQTGLGAIYKSILQGKTLVLRGDNLKWVRELGIKAYDYDELKDLSLDTLKGILLKDAEKAENVESYCQNYLQRYSNQFWRSEIFRVMKN